MIVTSDLLSQNESLIFLSCKYLGWPRDQDGSSHPTKVLSHPGPGPGLAWDRELPSHRDLVPSHPTKKIFVPSHKKELPSRSCPISSHERPVPSHPGPMTDQSHPTKISSHPV